MIHLAMPNQVGYLMLEGCKKSLDVSKNMMIYCVHIAVASDERFKPFTHAYLPYQMLSRESHMVRLQPNTQL
jgi:hypothetical protein